jgi:mannose/fructose/N-acetylgalactosamine-specific phosphotransferase system component IIC
MVVDWNIESFVKGVVSVTIAGAVVIGAGVYGLMWADQRIKNKQKRGVVPRRPQAKSDSESSSEDSSD